jgi:hypothetical protein
VKSIGFIFLALVVFGIPAVVAVADLFLTYRRGRYPIGYYMNEFAVDHPMFAGVLALVLGAMMAHFFLNITHG